MKKEIVDFIQKVTEIGGKTPVDLSLVDLSYFFPEYPKINSNVPYIIGWASAKFFVKHCENISDFVKGLHIIEMKYKKESGNDFGFGSIGPTFKVIEAIRGVDEGTAKELKLWVADHGGNYYI